jgi:hypothetical protein
MNHTARFSRNALALAIGACVCLTGCNRALVRFPGASFSFPETHTGFIAKRQLSDFINIEAPVDLRSAHYGESVAGSNWDGCRTDALWLDSASSILRERLNQEVASSNLFQRERSTLPNDGGTVLKSEIHAFCSQAIGVLFHRIAGIVSIKFTLERGGKVFWDRKIERVVTDADPEYTGSQIGFIEQAMRTTTADSLRLVLSDLLKAMDRDLSKPVSTIPS